MEKGKLIYSGRWSLGYVSDGIFIKELVYYDPNSVKREMEASNAAFGSGIPTPKCFRYFDDGIHIQMHFQYIDMIPFEIGGSDEDLNSVLDIVQRLQYVQWKQNDEYWTKNLIPDFSDALSYIGFEREHIMAFVSQLKPTTFIHGDMSCQNIGRSKEGVCIYDFQHGCLGPKNWDLCHLAGTLRPFLSESWDLSDGELQMAFCIAAIKLGRAIRKNASDIDEKKSIYNEWKKRICAI